MSSNSSNKKVMIAGVCGVAAIAAGVWLWAGSGGDSGTSYTAAPRTSPTEGGSTGDLGESDSSTSLVRSTPGGGSPSSRLGAADAGEEIGEDQASDSVVEKKKRKDTTRRRRARKDKKTVAAEEPEVIGGSSKKQRVGR